MEQKLLNVTDASNRGDPYWQRVQDAATLISSYMQVESKTISVSCCKEKFGRVRVYCELAEGQLLHDLFGREPTLEEARSTAIEDCSIYSEAYRLAVSLAPDLKTAITQDADYQEILAEGPALEEMTPWLLEFWAAKLRVDDPIPDMKLLRSGKRRRL